MRPVFRGGELYCYLASAAHWHDVGGAVPGNYNPAATECWQEAVQIPPVRMVRGGELDEDVLAILKANSRLPDSLWGDLNGQLAALELGAGRLDDLLQEYGDDTVRAALDTAPARPAPDAGPRSQPAGRRVPLSRHAGQRRRQGRRADHRPALRASGERLELDFGDPPACAGPVNISRATAVAACYVALHVFPDVPANAGVLDAVTVTLPDGLLISAERRAPWAAIPRPSCA